MTTLLTNFFNDLLNCLRATFTLWEVVLLQVVSSLIGEHIVESFGDVDFPLKYEINLVCLVLLLEYNRVHPVFFKLTCFVKLFLDVKGEVVKAPQLTELFEVSSLLLLLHYLY